LGAIPSSTSSGCKIDPFEGDNLLDATQRHTSMDWNTVVQGPESGVPPGTYHTVDTPSHQSAGGLGADGENMAGEIVARSYLLTSATTYTNPYAILRDVSTGCAYYNPATYAGNAALLNTASLSTLHCKTDPTTEGCQAVASTKDLSCPNAPGDDPNCGITNWLDPVQQDLHSSDAEVIPQGCYANGSGSANAVAWVRGPEWVGTPNPDDAYVGARVSAALAYAAEENRVIQMQFQLPVMPSIPQSGYLTGSEQLRYYSLTFIQEQEPDGPSIIGDIDGVDTKGNYPTKTIVSLADPAFCTSTSCAQSSCTSGTCYVTLILGVGGGSLSGIEGSSAGCTAGTYATFGFGNASTACIPWNQGYTVLDLTQSGLGATLSTTQDLQIVMRNTLPNSSFTSAGQWVPFYTAEYTGGNAGLMGPYAPVVSYPTISSLNGTTAPTSPTLESTASLPTTRPVLTTVNGTTLSLTGNTVQWPTFWPGTASPASQNLVCPATGISPNQPTTLTINFAASLVSPEVSSTCISGTPGACNYVLPLYTQTDAFNTATAPPMPVTIVGSGFGYLGETLPYATQSSQYLEVNDSASGTTRWDTGTGGGGASCQMYIANWSDTSISLVINAPIEAYNLYLGTGDYLSPLSDFSPLTLFPNANNTQSCPVDTGDTLTFTVTNPQTMTSGASMSVCVGTPYVTSCPS
jgi:hypothetical protein